jgi:soluble lytic murein transglycosylase-like protein
MGALARELGCREPYLTCLVDPAVNLHYGCLHLANLLKWAKGDTEQALAAYNGGKAGNKTRPFRNASYAAKVLAHMEAPV